jgi:hypothetical protein
MESILDTCNYESIYENILRLFSISNGNLQQYICNKAFEHNNSIFMYSDEGGDFYSWAKNNVSKSNKLGIGFVTIYHFARRLEPLNVLKTMPLYNVRELVICETSFNKFLNAYGITFKEVNDKIVCLYNGNEFRLTYRSNRLNDDRCINGFLFGGNIFKEGDISHLKDSPELIIDIQRSLNELKEIDIIQKFKQMSKAYIFKIKVPINELIFDGCGFENECDVEYNLDSIFKYIGSYLVNDALQNGFSNPIVRLKDNAIVEKDNILEIYEIHEKELIY